MKRTLQRRNSCFLVLTALFLGQTLIHPPPSLSSQSIPNLKSARAETLNLPLSPSPKAEANAPVFRGISAPGYLIQSQSVGGLHLTTFTTPHGKVTVNLTDDLAAGDTFSGTVVDEPAGRSDNERNENQSELNGYVVDLQKQQTKVADGTLTRTIPAVVTNADRTLRLIRKGKEVARAEIPIASEAQDTLTGFVLPTGGQQGRTIQIKGPCNGRFGEGDFVKIGQKVAENIAESPRTIIVRNTSDEIGPTKLECHENGTVAECPFRNLGIKLAADKLSLLRGETTQLHVTVLGLAGIDRDVPLELVNKSPDIISMGGGTEQRTDIGPGQVKSDGTYLTDRTLTGKVQGTFVITATVVWANVCKDGVEIADGPDVNRDGSTSRDLDDKYETCGPGCKRRVVKEGMVFCTPQDDCKSRGEKCECNLFEAPLDDKDKKWNWVAGPFPTKWKYDPANDYLCLCSKKK